MHPGRAARGPSYRRAYANSPIGKREARTRHVCPVPAFVFGQGNPNAARATGSQIVDRSGEVRDRLLDAIHVTLESTPDARARMIRLEVKHAAAQELGLPLELARFIIPLSILAIPGSKPVILCQDREIVHALESQDHLTSHLAQNGRTEHQGIQILVRSSSNFQPDRILYDGLTFKPTKNTS